MNTVAEMTLRKGSVTTIARLNIRLGSPTTSAPIRHKVEPGTSLRVDGLLDGEDVKGNTIWYVAPDGSFFWSGGCSDLVPEGLPTTQTPNVRRRPTGTILPLSDSEMPRVFGVLPYREGQRGRIVIDAAWVKANIVKVKIPVLAHLGYPEVELHKKAADPYERVFKAIDEAGLSDRLLTCEGTFVPRHKGWNPARGISSHSWGIAIDLNAPWNGYGSRPAQLGTHGSVRELVPLFEAEGFAWGGYFGGDYVDGMHFELARTDL